MCHRAVVGGVDTDVGVVQGNAQLLVIVLGDHIAAGVWALQIWHNGYEITLNMENNFESILMPSAKEKNVESISELNTQILIIQYREIDVKSQ